VVSDPSVVFHDDYFPRASLAVDEKNVYLLDPRRLGKVPKSGGTLAVLQTDRMFLGVPLRLALDDDNVYWTTNSTDATEPGRQQLRRRRKDGSEGAVITGISSIPGGFLDCVAVDANSIYWVQGNDWRDGDSILRVPKAGGSPQRIAKRYRHSCFAVDTSRIYFHADNAVRSAPLTGGSTTSVVVRVDDVDELHVDDTNLYWIESQKIMTVPKEGGKALKLAEGAGRIQRMALDETSVFFTVAENIRDSATGQVCRIAKKGGIVTVLASEQRDPFDIAVDREAVYWTHENGVAKVRKP
jgi:hypothetical protein